MHIPIELIILFLAPGLALQGWTLKELINLKTKVAVLEDHFRVFRSDTEHIIKSQT